MSAVMPFFYTVDSVLFPILTGLINHSPIGFIIKRSKGCGLSVSRHGIFNVVKSYNAAPPVENQARIISSFPVFGTLAVFARSLQPERQENVNTDINKIAVILFFMV